MILFIFSLFQSQHFFIDPYSLSYKELALYVQKGFWELLAVAGLGATLWYIGYRSLFHKGEGSQLGKPLLIAFTIELLLLSLFSQHKLLTQQVIFGLRDQRVLATCGVLLINMSFLGFLGVLLQRITLPRVFMAQYWGLIVISLALNYGNLDSFITRTHPLRFNHNSKMHLDFAYLLTNSYDNNAQWNYLMERAYEDKLPMPEGYYWGVYKSLCSNTNYNPRLSIFGDTRSRSYNYHGAAIFTDHINYLVKKYGSAATQQPRKLLTFNLREWQAFNLVQANPERFSAFDNFILKSCPKGSTNMYSTEQLWQSDQHS